MLLEELQDIVGPFIGAEGEVDRRSARAHISGFADM